jgi:hypothetical protein
MLPHGVQHDLAVNATVSRDGNNVTIHCAFVIPHVAWGLETARDYWFNPCRSVSSGRWKELDYSRKVGERTF